MLQWRLVQLSSALRQTVNTSDIGLPYSTRRRVYKMLWQARSTSSFDESGSGRLQPAVGDRQGIRRIQTLECGRRVGQPMPCKRASSSPARVSRRDPNSCWDWIISQSMYTSHRFRATTTDVALRWPSRYRVSRIEQSLKDQAFPGIFQLTRPCACVSRKTNFACHCDPEMSLLGM